MISKALGALMMFVGLLTAIIGFRVLYDAFAVMVNGEVGEGIVVALFAAALIFAAQFAANLGYKEFRH